MKCIVLIQNDKFEIKEQQKPKPGFGQVLIKIMAAPINPSDIQLLCGLFKVQNPYPLRLGIEGSGLVVQNGGGMIGQNFLNKKVAFRVPNELVGKIGTYAQYIVLPALICMGFQDQKITYSEASMSIVNPLTAYALLDKAKKGNHKAVVSTAAASQLGRMIIRLFKQQGIQTINIVRRQQQFKMLKEQQQAQYVLNSSDENFKDQFKDLTNKLNVKLCYDAIAGKDAGKILDIMPFGSTIQVYGGLSGQPVSQVRLKDMIFMQKTVKGFILNDWTDEKGQSGTFDALQKVGRMIPNILKSKIIKQLPFQKLSQGIQIAKANQSNGKVILTF